MKMQLMQPKRKYDLSSECPIEPLCRKVRCVAINFKSIFCTTTLIRKFDKQKYNVSDVMGKGYQVNNVSSFHHLVKSYKLIVAETQGLGNHLHLLFIFYM